jgi:hypothetical protein
MSFCVTADTDFSRQFFIKNSLADHALYSNHRGFTVVYSYILTLYNIHRMPVGVRFSAPTQTDPRAHPASCKMCTWSLRQGVEWLGRGIDHPPPSPMLRKE